MQVNIILCKIKQAPLGKKYCYLGAVRKFSFFFFFLVQVLKINHFNLCSLVNMQLSNTIFLYLESLGGKKLLL